jgi:hypothetical protein
MKIVGGSALSRGLNESFRNVITESRDNVRDAKGDKWSSHSAVRNEFHPDFKKSKQNPNLDGIEHEEQPRAVWLNHRSGSIHEGGMLLHPDGIVFPHSHIGEPKMFHQEHYFFEEE